MLRRCTYRVHSTVLIRQLSVSSEAVPIIRIPKYLEKGLGNAIYKEHMKVKAVRAKQRSKVPLEPKHVNKLIISSNGDKRLNHYYGYRYEVERVPLISKDWIRQSSVGIFIISSSFFICN